MTIEQAKIEVLVGRLSAEVSTSIDIATALTVARARVAVLEAEVQKLKAVDQDNAAGPSRLAST